MMYRNVAACFLSAILLGRVIPLFAQDPDPEEVSARDSVPDKPKLELIGNGALGLHGGERTETGAFGLRITRPRSSLLLVATILSDESIESVDQASFAQSLVPIRSSGTGGFIQYRKTGFLGSRIAIQAYGNIAGARWTQQRVENGERIDVQSERGMLAAAGFDVLYNPLYDIDVGANTMSAYVGVGWTGRGLLGTIAQEDSFRRNTLGTTKALFHGPEAAFILTINGVDVQVYIPIFLGRDVRNLTGGTYSANVSLQAGITLTTP
jgi:hypothetical protein